MALSNGILHGLRVIEISAFVAAPLGGMTLAQMGADVIRIDPPTGGLDYRRWPVTEDDVSLFWAGLNKSKRSVAIDITTSQGRELAQALIAAPGEDAGILLTNFPARGWLDHQSLRARRADLIQLTIQGDHLGGSTVDYTVNAGVGIPYLTGHSAHEHPVNHVLPAWDLITGQMAAVGILAAERHRRRTGEGQHVKLALQDVAMASLAHLGFIAEAQRGIERARYGNDLFGAFGRDFETRDGVRIMVIGLTLKQWRSLCEATGMAAHVQQIGLRCGIDLDREGDRFEAREEIAAFVSAWIGSRNVAQIAAIFDAHAVCWSRYQTIKQMVDGDAACSKSNPMFHTVQQPGVGPVLSPAVPLDFGSGRLPAQPAPRLGEHTEQVLSQMLGMNAAEVERLKSSGIIGT